MAESTATAAGSDAMDAEAPLVDGTVRGCVDFKGRPVLRSKSGCWKSASFIVGVEMAERFAYYGISSNLISYLTGPLGQSTAAAAANVNAWSGTASLSPLLGAFVADSFLGRYRTIIAASLLYILGLGLLSVSAALNPTDSSPSSNDVIFFFVALYLVAFAVGGHKPCLQAFGADQFDKENGKELQSMSSFFNWWNFCLCVTIVVGLLVLTYIQENLSWVLGFGIPCIAMCFALLVFLLGMVTYRFRLKSDERNPFVRIARVLVKAAQNWKAVPADAAIEEEGGAQFRFLDQALFLEPNGVQHIEEGCDVVRGKYLHMRCMAHVVNLIVGDGLKVIGQSIKRVRDAVRYVRNSPARLTKFRECCREENIGSKSLLVLDVPTRWNSTYLMLSVALKFEKAFELFDAKDPYFKIDLTSGVPTSTDWEIAKRMSEILLVFYELTLRISASLQVTSNLAYHEISNIHVLLKEWVNCSNVDVKAMGEKMMLKYQKYWGEFEKMNMLVYVAVVLDPRYKLDFLEYTLVEEYGDEKGKKAAIDLKFTLTELYEAYKPPSVVQVQGNQSEASILSQTHTSQKPPTYIMGSQYKKFKTSRGDVSKQNELDVYLKEDTLDVEKEDFNILSWWQVQKYRFPVLSLLARDVLTMPTSTVASESAFSTGGRILDPYRSSLTPKIVEALVCGQDWIKYPNLPTSMEEDLDSIEKHEEGISNIGSSIKEL